MNQEYSKLIIEDDLDHRWRYFEPGHL